MELRHDINVSLDFRKVTTSTNLRLFERTSDSHILSILFQFIHKFLLKLLLSTVGT